MIERLGAAERFLVFSREKREDFPSPGPPFGSSGLDLLVGSWRDWRRRPATHGSSYEFSASVIVWELGARKVRRKRTGSVVGHNLKIEECFLQKLWASKGVSPNLGLKSIEVAFQ